jgi:hypothetical protein
VAPVDTQRVWLTEDAYNRMKVELANLLVERFGYGVENGDPETGEQPSRDMDDGAARANWQHRELRIRQLKELIRSAVVLESPDHGVAEPRMVLTVRYDGCCKPWAGWRRRRTPPWCCPSPWNCSASSNTPVPRLPRTPPSRRPPRPFRRPAHPPPLRRARTSGRVRCWGERRGRGLARDWPGTSRRSEGGNGSAGAAQR